MADINIDVSNDQILEDVNDWKKYLNNFVGIYCYGAALSVFNSTNRFYWGISYFAIIIYFTWSKTREYESEYFKLSRKIYRRIYEEYNFNNYIKHYFKLSDLFIDIPAYTAGVLLLAIAMFISDKHLVVLKKCIINTWNYAFLAGLLLIIAITIVNIRRLRREQKALQGKRNLWGQA